MKLIKIPMGRKGTVIAGIEYDIVDDTPFFESGGAGRGPFMFDPAASSQIVRARALCIDDPAESGYVLCQLNSPAPREVSLRDSLYAARSYETALRTALRERLAIYDPLRQSFWRPVWPSRYAVESRTITNMQREELDCYLSPQGSFQIPPEARIEHRVNFRCFRHGRSSQLCEL